MNIFSKNYSARDIGESDFYACETESERINHILSYGILAPSTHNSQPWLFAFKDNEVRIFLDSKRLLPEADRSQRDAHMSIGCLIKNIEIAANYFGVLEHIEFGEEPDGSLARIVFVPQEGRREELRPLLDAILRRYNARGEMLPLPAETKDRLRSVSFPDGVSAMFVEKQEEMEQLGALTKSGIESFHNNRAFRKEFSTWMRGNLSKKRDGIHGYSVFMPLIISYIIPTIMRHKSLGRQLGRINELGISKAPLAVVILLKNENPVSLMRAGMLIEELALTAFANFAAASFYAAPIEDAAAREGLKKMLNTALLPQFMIVFGIPKKPLPTTPRLTVIERTIRK